jgi:hypothetical protein
MPRTSEICSVRPQTSVGRFVLAIATSLFAASLSSA